MWTRARSSVFSPDPSFHWPDIPLSCLRNLVHFLEPCRCMMRVEGFYVRVQRCCLKHFKAFAICIHLPSLINNGPKMAYLLRCRKMSVCSTVLARIPLSICFLLSSLNWTGCFAWIASWFSSDFEQWPHRFLILDTGLFRSGVAHCFCGGPDGTIFIEVPERAIWEPQSRCKIERSMWLGKKHSP